MSSANALQCTLQAIQNFNFHNYISKCEYVKAACENDDATIDFFRFYYCNLSEDPTLFVLFAIAFFFVAFYWISTTAEDYLEPALSTIAERFNFSESLAGITLVSLANGAPDVFAAFAAGSVKEEGIFFPLGGLLGGGIFTSSVVLAICILSSKTASIQAIPGAFNRDSLFYLVSVVYLLSLGIYGEINFAGVLGFCVIYVVFIGLVIYNETLIKNTQNIDGSEEDMLQDGEICILYDYDEEAQIEGLVKSDYIATEKISIENGENTMTKRGESPRSNNQMHMNRRISSNSKERANAYNSPHFSFNRLQWRYYKIKKNVKRELRDIREKSIFGKFLSIISIPNRIIGSLTIPASNDAQYHKTIAMIQPFTVTLFLFWQLDLLEVFNDNVSLGFGIFLGLGLSFFIWKTTKSGVLPQGFVGFLFLLTSFVCSAVWLNLVAHTVIDFVSLLSLFTGLPLNYLGLTLLAWGNSLPDLYVDMALVKKGLDQTALSGIFGDNFSILWLVLGFLY